MSSNNENAYIVKIDNVEALIISPTIVMALKRGWKAEELKTFLDSYGIKMFVSQDAVNYLNKLFEEKSQLDIIDTKFPELEEGVWGFVNQEKIDDWFKRCLADRPKSLYRDHGVFNEYLPPTDGQYRRWISKWFWPFMEES